MNRILLGTFCLWCLLASFPHGEKGVCCRISRRERFGTRTAITMTASETNKSKSNSGEEENVNAVYHAYSDSSVVETTTPSDGNFIATDQFTTNNLDTTIFHGQMDTNYSSTNRTRSKYRDAEDADEKPKGPTSFLSSGMDDRHDSDMIMPTQKDDEFEVVNTQGSYFPVCQGQSGVSSYDSKNKSSNKKCAVAEKSSSSFHGQEGGKLFLSEKSPKNFASSSAPQEQPSFLPSDGYEKRDSVGINKQEDLCGWIWIYRRKF